MFSVAIDNIKNKKNKLVSNKYCKKFLLYVILGSLMERICREAEKNFGVKLSSMSRSLFIITFTTLTGRDSKRERNGG